MRRTPFHGLATLPGPAGPQRYICLSNLPSGQLEGRLHPVPEALLEAGRVQPGEDPAKRVVRGEPVRPCQDGTQPLFVEPPEEGPSLRSCPPRR